MSLAKTLVILPSALGALLGPAAAIQVRSATITSAVTDQSGAVAAKVEVVVTNSGTNQNQADSSAVTNATDAQVINDVPDVTQNPLFYVMLQNCIQPRNETSTSTLGDL
jgi:trimeric autotransporter adhesin